MFTCGFGHVSFAEFSRTLQQDVARPPLTLHHIVYYSRQTNASENQLWLIFGRESMTAIVVGPSDKLEGCGRDPRCT